ncbi:secreted protein [gut metagenome]|uniref:Secreted protein n=1 Tax=gut metagenome TaxID=749906 RepID=J9F503_9ZZZZ
MYITSRRIHSTKLFRLLCSRLAALFKASSKSLSSLNAVCFLVATSIISILWSEDNNCITQCYMIIHN